MRHNEKNVLIFTLYNILNHNDQLRVRSLLGSIYKFMPIRNYIRIWNCLWLGASRPEEAARWIRSFHEASYKLQSRSFVSCNKNLERECCKFIRTV